MKNHVKFISYDGKYPNLCRGFNSDYSESFVETGSWEIDKLRLPEQFHKYTDEIYKVMNENMELPCCGGCL